MTFGGFRATGREIRDPTGTLVELTNQDDLHHLAIVFESPYREHITLNRSVELVESFLRFPMVIGLAELASWHPKQGAFVYPTGQIWTVAELLRSARQKGQPLGARAALEIGVLAGQILTEASDIGRIQGCFAHGNISPWRIALKRDGQVMVLGHGLPQMDWLLHLQDKKRPLKSESLRYAPPERVEGQPEGLSSDIYGLAVVMVEMMMGEPLFVEASLAKLKSAITMSEGETRVGKRGNGVPKAMHSVLQSALIYDPHSRPSGEAFVDALHALLDHPSIKGPSLFQLMSDYAQEAGQAGGVGKHKLISEPDTQSRQRKPGGKTTTPKPPKSEEKRWKRRTGARRASEDSPTKTIAIQLSDKPTRARRRKDPAEETQTTPDPSTSSRRRRKKGTGDGENTVARRRRKTEESATQAKAPPTEEPDSTVARKRRRRKETQEGDKSVARLRRRSDPKEAATSPSPEPAEESAVQAVTLAPPETQVKAKARPKAEAVTEIVPVTEDTDNTVARKRRRRREAKEEEASPSPVTLQGAAVQSPSTDDADNTVAKRRRRRSESDDADNTVAKRRRRRSEATESDETSKAEASPATDQTDNTVARRRRRRSEAKEGDEVTKAEEAQDKPRQRRRGAAKKK